MATTSKSDVLLNAKEVTVGEPETQVGETLAAIANHLKAATAVANALRRHALFDVEASRSGQIDKNHATAATVIQAVDQIKSFIDHAQKALGRFG